MLNSDLTQKNGFSTFEDLLAYVNKHSGYDTFTFSGTSDISKALTNELLTSTCKGIITVMGLNYFDFFIFVGGNQYVYTGRYNEALAALYSIGAEKISL